MKKHLGLLTVLPVIALTVFFYFRFFFVFGEGVKSGELNYVVYKGVLFKTYEGKLIQTGIRSKEAGSIQSYEFEFSVEADSRRTDDRDRQDAFGQRSHRGSDDAGAHSARREIIPVGRSGLCKVKA